MGSGYSAGIGSGDPIDYRGKSASTSMILVVLDFVFRLFNYDTLLSCVHKIKAAYDHRGFTIKRTPLWTTKSNV